MIPTARAGNLKPPSSLPPKPVGVRLNPSNLKKLSILAALVVLVSLGWWVAKARQSAAGDSPGGRRGGGPAGQTVPVVATDVMRQNVSIFLDGLGTVQAFNSVTVRARVDGQLMKVSFVEGQD